MSVTAKLEIIRREMGLPSDQFYEMTIGQLATIRHGAVIGCKWTRGEVAAIVSSKDGDRALEVLQYLDERGPRVIDWTDDREPCPECEVVGCSDACDRARTGEDGGERRADLSEALEGVGT